MASYEEHKALKPIMHEHDNLGELVAYLGTVFRDKLSDKYIVMVMEVAAKPEPAKDYKKTQIVQAMKEQALAANSQKPTSERRPLSIIEFLRYLYLLLYIQIY